MMNSSLLQQEILDPVADQEKAANAVLQRKRISRASFIEWCRYKGFEPALHHQSRTVEFDSVTATAL